MNSSAESDPGLIELRFAVTDILVRENIRTQLISTQEALVMQAAAHVLSVQDCFHPVEVSDRMGVYPGATFHTIRQLERDDLLEIHHEARNPSQQGKSRPRRFYSSTELGRTVFELFTEKLQ